MNRRTLWGVLYAAWFTMAAVLLSGVVSRPRGGLRAPEELLRGVWLPPEESWMGIYLGDAKVGFVRTETQPLPGGGYSITEHSRISAGMMGVPQEMTLRIHVVTDSTLALTAFDGELDSPPYNTTFSGKLDREVLAVTLTTGNSTRQRFIPAPEPLYVSQVIKPLVQAGRLDEGDSLKLAGFDPLSLEMQELTIRGGKLTPRKLGGREVVVRRLVSEMAGIRSELLVDEHGDVLMEQGPMGLVMRRESAEEAQDMAITPARLDLLGAFAVSPGGDISAPRSVTFARYRVRGVPGEKLAAASPRQKWSASDSTLTVDAGAEPGSLTRADSAAALADAPFIESRHPRILSAASEAVRGATTRADTLRRLSEWVDRAVANKPAWGLPSALAVLERREGDCNEHTVLFTAMARALGIPSRIQMGLVYQDGRFFYHAWPAAHVDGRWREFDPTFGQIQADAARIALAAGDLSQSYELAQWVGNIRVDILEAR